MKIEIQTSPNKMDRAGWKPDVIVDHITDGGFYGAVETLKTSSLKRSANFVVSRTGKVVQLVPIKTAAMCNGTQSTTPAGANYVGRATAELVRQRKVNANYYTISIEHEGIYSKTHGELTEAQLEATIELHRYIIGEVKRIYGIDIPIDRSHIIGHYQIAPREKPDCPGERFPFDRIIAALKTQKPAPITHIDSPLKNTAVKGDITVRGWTISPAGMTRADFWLDAKLPLGSIRILTDRPDVEQAYTGKGYQNARKSGILFTVPYARLPKGEHILGVAGVPGKGVATWANIPIRIM